MFYKSFPLLVIGLWGLIVLPLQNRVSAITPLTRAEIQNLRNIVQLIPKDKLKKRAARKLDAMTPGDGLSTGRASLADLRFNDGSLARVGEQALFQFLPKTRDFKLTNGTVLLLIPPGKGQTRIQTPNAAAAIRGSALFVRYDQQTDTTIVGALTNSGIEVSNKKASQTQVLEAGQMVIIVKGEFQRLYDFDLRNFYETSQMVRELDLNRQVQAETSAALEAQPPIKGEGVIENPSFVQLTPTPDTSTETTSDTSTKTTPDTSTKTTPDTSTKTTPDTPIEPTPDTPVEPTPDTPIETTPDTPVEPTPVTPVTPTPVTPVTPTPVTSTDPTPVTPIDPTPVTPIDPTPVTPVTPTPVTSTDPTPVTPVTPTPVTPVTPTPVTSTDPTPVTPIDPTPVTPIDPTPVTPVTPTPVIPIDPTPVTPTPVTPTPVTPTPVTPTPVTPTPVTPVTPTPVTPVTPTPVTPTDSPST
ncbi:FecR family protein [Nostoc sp. JL23]|uniref:FecR family protein n=2 Tax=Nostoc TaxID=1177 RepID=UPI001DDCDBB7|nr:FecR family protein [Nostoc sp. JL23]MBN3877239.1 FecR domain-containing protein [Nostoc sp. JL23]